MHTILTILTHERLNACIGMWICIVHQRVDKRALGKSAYMIESRRLSDSSFSLLTVAQLGMAVMRQLGKGMSFNLRSDSARGNRVHPRS